MQLFPPCRGTTLPPAAHTSIHPPLIVTPIDTLPKTVFMVHPQPFHHPIRWHVFPLTGGEPAGRILAYPVVALCFVIISGSSFDVAVRCCGGYTLMAILHHADRIQRGPSGLQ